MRDEELESTPENRIDGGVRPRRKIKGNGAGQRNMNDGWKAELKYVFHSLLEVREFRC